jgi:hypothetical protein
MGLLSCHAGGRLHQEPKVMIVIAIFRQRPSRMHTHPSRAVRESSLRYVLITQLLLLSSVALGGDQPASCELASKSIVSRSSSGLAQVSNLGDIQITCRVPARAFPTKPGESRSGLKVATGAYQIFPNGSKKRVPSEEHQTGGGGSGGEEWVIFYVHIPLEPTERDDEARRYLAKLEKSMAPQITEEARQRALEQTREFVLPTSGRPFPSGVPHLGW